MTGKRLQATIGLGCKATLTRNQNTAVLNRHLVVANGKVVISAISWYVPQNKPSVDQHDIIAKQI